MIINIDAPIIQKTVEPAEAKKNNGSERRNTKPYCSLLENDLPNKFTYFPRVRIQEQPPIDVAKPNRRRGDVNTQ